MTRIATSCGGGGLVHCSTATALIFLPTRLGEAFVLDNLLACLLRDDFLLVWFILWIILFELLFPDRLHEFVELSNLLV